MVLCSFQGACRSPSSLFILPHHSGLVNCFFHPSSTFFPAPCGPVSLRPFPAPRSTARIILPSYPLLFNPLFPLLPFFRSCIPHIFTAVFPLSFDVLYIFCFSYHFMAYVIQLRRRYPRNNPCNCPADRGIEAGDCVKGKNKTHRGVEPPQIVRTAQKSP